MALGVPLTFYGRAITRFLPSPLAVAATGGVGFENTADFIANSTEDCELLVFCAGGVSRIIEAPVVPVYLAGKCGADLVRVSANGDDGFDFPIEKFAQVLGVVRTGVDANFCKRADGERVDKASGFAAGACDFENITRGGAEDGFGEMRPARIAGAEDEDEWLHIF